LYVIQTCSLNQLQTHDVTTPRAGRPVRRRLSPAVWRVRSCWSDCLSL